MAKEIDSNEVLGKMSGATMIPKGSGKKLMGVMAMVMAINAFPAPTVQAAEMPINPTNEIVQLQEFKEDFNLTFTEGNQKELINAGYFIGDKLDMGSSNLESVVNNVKDSHQNFLNKNEISKRDFSLVDYAKEVNNKYGVEDAPNFLLSTIDSPYPNMDELTPLALNTITAKAEYMTQKLDKKPYKSVEEAYEFMQQSYNTKIRYNGGADVYDEKGEWEDISMDQADVMKGFVKFASSGVTEEMKDNLPNYLTTYKKEDQAYQLDDQANELANDLKSELNEYEAPVKQAKRSNGLKNGL